MEEIDKISVEKFVVACNDVLSGKFLDIRKKLSLVMKTISDSEEILSLLAESLTDVDEEELFNKTFVIDNKTKNGKACLPSDEKERLAVTVILLNDIQSGKINITQFFETYFRDNSLAPTQNFLVRVLKPFRDIIAKNFGVDVNVNSIDILEHIQENEKNEKDEEVEEVKEEEKYPEIENLMLNIQKTAKEIQARLKFEKKKNDIVEDLDFILNALLKACEGKDLLVINGLILGVNYASKKFKDIRYLVQELNETIYGYYDFLAGDLEVENEEKEYDYEENEEDL